VFIVQVPGKIHSEPEYTALYAWEKDLITPLAIQNALNAEGLEIQPMDCHAPGAGELDFANL